MITIKHLKKEYPGATPLKDVNAVINRGDVISVIGPSGTGKSTLIRCINLLETPTAGEIIIDGEVITEKGCRIDKVRRKMGMVFQSFNLFGHLTVLENLMIAPMDLKGKTKQEAREKAMELLRMVGLADKAGNYPDELSGGQKQRVAIARTLAMEPEIILLDEPTSALDPTMVGEVEMVIRELAKQGLTMMIVTHEMRFAKEVANRVFYMDQGGIYEDGTPEEIFGHPKKERTIRFIRQLKVLEERITSKDFDFIGMVGKLEEFGRRHRISQPVIYRMQAVFEELCVQILLPALAEPLDMNMTVEYSPQTGGAKMCFAYGGESYDPFVLGNELSLQIIKNAAVSTEYTRTENEEHGNRVEVEIRG